MSLPSLRLKANADRRLRNGHLWVYSNEIDVAATPLHGFKAGDQAILEACLLYTSPSPRDRQKSRMPSSA